MNHKVWVPPKWYPECAQRHTGSVRPPVGELIGRWRAVWRVLAVEDVPMDAEDTKRFQEWMRWRGSDPWPLHPFRVEIEFVGGVIPKKLDPEKDGRAALTIRSYNDHETWMVYPHGRWPRCSCCGEPMPCRAELQDLKVDAAVQKMEEQAAKLPGCCWDCGEPVTRRHKTVRYAGENLDLPGGPPVVFHIRASCHHLAVTYERKWLKADRSRRRILTYPACPGWLVWHADGSSECVNGDPECQGNVSHNHGSQAGCKYMEGGCPRGCDPRKSSCRPRRGGRPDYRDPDLPQGRPDGEPQGLLCLDAEDAGGDDGRTLCPGHLLVHQDGTSECIAGGRDDCWGGDTYRHARRRDCRSQTHGCPKCETTEGLA